MTRGARVLALCCGTVVMATVALVRSRTPPNPASEATPAVLESAEATRYPSAAERPASPGRRGQAAVNTPEPRQQAQAERATAAALPRGFELLKLGNLNFPGLEEMERSFSAEPRDAQSSAMEARILDEIAQKALGLELVDLQVECRTTLCRLQMAFPESLAHKKFGVVPRDARWTGKEPIGFFIAALDLEFQLDVGALDENGAPFSLSYISKAPAPGP